MQELHTVVGHNNELFMLYYSTGEGLCFKKREGGIFTPYKVVEEDLKDDFDAASINQTIYIAGQDKLGNIVLVKYFMGSWTKTILFESKTKISYPKQFKFLMAPSPVLFYTIKHQEKTMLVKYQVDGSLVVLDYIEPVFPISVCNDKKNNIIICYYSENGAGYRIIKGNEATDFNVFNERISDIELMASDNGFYFSGVNGAKYANKIDFKFIDLDGKISKEKSFENTTTVKKPLMCKVGNNVWLMWATQSQIIGTKSMDKGDNWSQPARFLNVDSSTSIFKFKMEGAWFNCYGRDSDTNPQLVVNNDVLINPPKQNIIVYEKPIGDDVINFAKENNDFFKNMSAQSFKLNEEKDLNISYENKDDDNNYNTSVSKDFSSNFDDFFNISDDDFKSYRSNNLPFDIEKEKERIKKELLEREAKNKNDAVKSDMFKGTQTHTSNGVNNFKTKEQPKPKQVKPIKVENEEYKKIISMLEKLTDKMEKLEKKVNSKQKKVIARLERIDKNRVAKKSFSDIMKSLGNNKDKS